MTEPTSGPALPRGVTGSDPAAALPPVEPPAPPAPVYAAMPAPSQPAPVSPGQEAAPSSGPAPSSGSKGLGKAIALVLAPVLAISLFAGGVVVGRSGAVASTEGTIATVSPSFATGDAGAELALIEEAWNDIQDHYVDAENLDNQELAYAAIRGLIEAVGDEGHTAFLTAEEAKAVNESLSGTFVGIGIRVNEDENGIPYVYSVIPNTPAEEAGLQRGDRLLAVDGKDTKDEPLDQTISRVRGPEGENVTLTIGRDGTADFDTTITRRQFDLPLVSWAMIPDHTVAMIRLDQFASGAGDAVKKAITEARAAGATSIIFDLRGNPGGYVGEAITVASQFVPDGLVFQAFDRSGERKDNAVEPGGLATDIPLVVLADADSASSAEIVSGAIQDSGRGKVVGETTFGTGTVLGQYDLKDGSSLRIGVERWLTRNGRPIWHEGLAPDVEVALGDSTQPIEPDDLRGLSWQEVRDAGDTQLLKAVELLAGDS
jgi:carboxyl-terminal processing protease